MNTTDNNQAGTADPNQNANGAPTISAEAARIAELEAELSKRDETIGSFKRELKDLKKPKDTADTTAHNAPNLDSNNTLLEETFFRSVGLTNEKERALARETAKKWNMDPIKMVDDPDWHEKLEKFRKNEANLTASTNIAGDGKGNSNPKYDIAYWKEKGTPPTPADVPDAVLRRKITRELMNSSKGKPKFYNE